MRRWRKMKRENKQSEGIKRKTYIAKCMEKSAPANFPIVLVTFSINLLSISLKSRPLHFRRVIWLCAHVCLRVDLYVCVCEHIKILGKVRKVFRI